MIYQLRTSILILILIFYCINSQTYMLPDGKWPLNAIDNSDPNGQWSVYAQGPLNSMNDPLGSPQPATPQTSETVDYSSFTMDYAWGANGPYCRLNVGQIGNRDALIYTNASSQYATAVGFKIPPGDRRLATITGHIELYRPFQGISQVTIYKLNSNMSQPELLWQYSMTQLKGLGLPSEGSYFKLTSMVNENDNIICHFKTIYGDYFTYVALKDYQIELSHALPDLPDYNWPQDINDITNPNGAWTAYVQNAANGMTDPHYIASAINVTPTGLTGEKAMDASWGANGRYCRLNVGQIGNSDALVYTDDSTDYAVAVGFKAPYGGDIATISGRVELINPYYSIANVSIYRLNPQMQQPLSLWQYSMTPISSIDLPHKGTNFKMSTNVTENDNILCHFKTTYGDYFTYVALKNYKIILDSKHVVPWFDSNNSNPYMDNSGNNWTVYQVSGLDSTDITNYDEMIWSSNPTPGYWVGPNLVWNAHPTYRAGLWLTSAGNDCEAGKKAYSAISIKTKAAGNYCWYGKLTQIDWAGTSSATVCFGKWNKNNAWKEIYKTIIPHGVQLDLANLVELQDIPVFNEEQLGIVVCPSYAGNNSVHFADENNNNIVGLFRSGIAECKTNYEVVPWWMETEYPGDGFENLETGNIWGIYQVTPQTASLFTSYESEVNRMQWDDDSSKWFGPQPINGHPSFSNCFERQLTSSNIGGQSVCGAVLFKSNEKQIYSWRGRIKHNNWISNNPCMVYFGKFSGIQHTYSELVSISISDNETKDLRKIPELQNILLQPNEHFVLYCAAAAGDISAIHFCPDGYKEENPAGLKPLDYLETRNIQDYGAIPDDCIDDTKAIQAALAEGYGVTYFPSGTYNINTTLHVYGGDGFNGNAKVIGDAHQRPKIVLESGSFPDENQAAGCAVVFYLNKTTTATDQTFQSQWENIDIEIESNNRGAIALNHSGAQGCHIRNTKITMVDAKIGILGIPGGSVCENIEVIGGEIGIVADDYSAWPATLKGCLFENQTGAGLLIWIRQLVVEGCVFNNCTKPISINNIKYKVSEGSLHVLAPGAPTPNLYIENCIFKDNTVGEHTIINLEPGPNKMPQVDKSSITVNKSFFKNFKYVFNSNVPVADNVIVDNWYKMDYCIYGFRWENWKQKAIGNMFEYSQATDCDPPIFTHEDFVKKIPSREDCVNIKLYGVKGDGIHDDTRAIQKAIDNATSPLFFPMGIYIVSNTITLRSNTKLIGEHCRYTVLQLVPNSGDHTFDDSLNPQPIIDTDDDPYGDAILAHFGFLTYYDDISDTNVPYKEFCGLVHMRWRVGRNSVIDDIVSYNADDNTSNAPYQTGYASLIVTGGGGGEFRQFQAPWRYLTGKGVLILEGVSEPTTIYGAGFEHSLYKPEVFINNSSNISIRTIHAENNYKIIEAYNSDNLTFNSIQYNYAIGEGWIIPTVGMDFYDCRNIQIYSFYKNDNECSPFSIAPIRMQMGGIPIILKDKGREENGVPIFPKRSIASFGWSNGPIYAPELTPIMELLLNEDE